MAQKKWDLTKGALTINAVPIVGFKEGDFITAEYAQDRHTIHASADNYARQSKNPNKHGTVMIGLSGNSPAMDIIQAFVDTDEPLEIAYKDFTANNSYVNAIDCQIVKESPFGRGNAIADVDWNFGTTVLDYKHGSPLNQ